MIKKAAAVRKMSARELERAMRLHASEERQAVVSFLTYLGELDRTRGYQTLNKNSLYAYVTERLGFPECQSFIRITSARLMRTYPVLADYLLDGRLSMTTLTVLRDVITPERLPDILKKASRQSKAVVKELAASFNAPVADYAEMRAARGAASVPYDPALHAARTTSAETAEGTVTVPVAAGGGVLVMGAPIVSSVRPLAEGQKEFAMTADRAFQADLETLADAYGYARGDFRRIVTRAIQSEVRRVNRRRGVEPTATPRTEPPIGETVRLQALTEKWAKDTRDVAHAEPPVESKTTEVVEPTVAKPPVTPSELPSLRWSQIRSVLRQIAEKFGRPYIPAKMQREVWRRANQCCEWRYANGARCGSRSRCQIDHIIPVAKNGKTILSNLRILCASHNLEAARVHFGSAFIDECIARSRAKQKAKRAAKTETRPPGAKESN